MTITLRKAEGISKVKGLIRSTKPEAIFLTTRFGIHTFGLRFPIDVVILDETYCPQVLKKHLVPNRIFLWNPRFKKVLELPEGFIKERGIKKGERITLSFR